ncbi:MAG: hypothetical protein ACO3BH_10820, partial [Quisquiliibacterium sp.]
MKIPWFRSSGASASRRQLLLTMPAMAALIAPWRAWASQQPTPSLAEGPYYPERFSVAPRASLLLAPIDGVTALRLHGAVSDLAACRLSMLASRSGSAIRWATTTIRATASPGSATP